LKDLIDRIKLDQIHRMKIEEPLPLNIFLVARNPDRSTTKLNGYFLHSLLLIDVLLRMKSIESDKQQLITLCKNEYKDNNKQLAIVHEFEEQYSSDTALSWYARECFLYKILNKALRVQNIDLLFLIRFVINDIYQQLKKHQCKTWIRVYRGQVMSNEELNNLQNSIGQLISINSYFSTSVDRSVALFMLGDPKVSYNLQRVLFIIEADPRVARTKPFAEIHSVSCFANELEVLFMVGSIFRLIDIRRNKKDLVWEIRMKLCGDDEHDLKNLFDHMKKEYGCGNNEVDLLSFGNVLLKMGEFDLTEKIYRRLLAERLSNDPSNDHLYYSLGMVTKDKGEYDLSLYWYSKSLKMKSQINPSDYISIGSLYNCIGVVHQEKGEDNEALKCYNEAIKLFKRNNDENHPYMADVYNNIGIIYNGQMNSSKALQFFQKSLTIQEKHLPSNHPDVGGSYLNIGGIYYGLRHYDLAMKYYSRSLEIWLQSLPPKHPKIAGNYSNIGLVHERKGALIQALVYYQKSVEIYHHSLPSQHPSVIQIEKHIKNILMRLVIIFPFLIFIKAILS
jgi:tetratricopeptide (TPR) repeat protein